MASSLVMLRLNDASSLRLRKLAHGRVCGSHLDAELHTGDSPDSNNRSIPNFYQPPSRHLLPSVLDTTV
jgi:hypothetical protein